MSSPWRQGVCALLAFILLSAVQAWPLPRHLSTHLTGPPSGDTGVYVWNTWVFRHELVEEGRSPFQTSSIFALSARADLSLHNYTVFADLLAVPVQPILGVVATFNLIYLLNVALAGFGMFVLARRLTGRALESWIAGAVFACAPFMVARSTAHFSLVAAAPLPFFVYWLDRALDTRRSPAGAAAGACLAWADFCDPYYAVYCVLLGACLVTAHVITYVRSGRRDDSSRALRIVLDAGIAALVLVMVLATVVSDRSMRVGSISISMRTLYTPVLILTVLVLARVALSFRVVMTWRPLALISLARPVMATLAVAALLLSPTLYAVGRRLLEDRMPSLPIWWRSSAGGVDLAAFFLPSPDHPLIPSAVADWIARRVGGSVEDVAAVPLVGLLAILLSWRYADFKISRRWLAITIGFGLLALGPFVAIAGVKTYVPTPWALLRYVPLIGTARVPSRFAVVVLLGFCVILATALTSLSRRFPQSRAWWLAIVGCALAVELLPIPRTLYSARVPAIYDIIAADSRPIRVLELPYGVRDGVSSIGNFSAASQFYQTRHGKPIAGGYVSRVSARRKAAYEGLPVPRALLALSEGRTLTVEEAERGRRAAARFLTRSEIGYVVIDAARASPELRRFAIEALGLTRIADADGYELYVPLTGPL